MAFEYRGQELVMTSASKQWALKEIVKGREMPVYVYDWPGVAERLNWYDEAFSAPVEIRYALKANSHVGLLRHFAKAEVGADVVSGGELDRAIAAGVAPRRIVFSGVGKSITEIKRAIEAEIGQINVESLPELRRLAALAAEMNRSVPVALRLNPDVHVATHHFIATGHGESKFGLPLAQLNEALEIFRQAKKNVKFQGLAIHVGSQIMDFAPLCSALAQVRELFVNLKGEGWPLQTFDIGGGLGLDYANGNDSLDRRHLTEYAKAVESFFRDLKAQILLEPGRFLMARAGVLLVKIEYIKETPRRRFVVVNGGMNHLLRPALYQAEHRIVALEANLTRSLGTFDIVGPICESSDVLGVARSLREPREGEWLAILDSGAYGYSMASGYNLRPLPDEVLLGADEE